MTRGAGPSPEMAGLHGVGWVAPGEGAGVPSPLGALVSVSKPPASHTTDPSWQEGAGYTLGF